MAVSVRLAHLGDAEAVSDCLREAFAPLRDRYTPAAFAATVPGPEAIRARLKGSRCWVAQGPDGIVGTVAAAGTPAGVYVQSLAVVPAARGHGVGRALLEAVARHAQEDGSVRLYLCTTPFLEDAIRLYRSAGFHFIPGEPGDLHGTPLLGMERWLGPPGSPISRPATSCGARRR